MPKLSVEELAARAHLLDSIKTQREVKNKKVNTPLSHLKAVKDQHKDATGDVQQAHYINFVP